MRKKWQEIEICIFERRGESVCLSVYRTFRVCFPNSNKTSAFTAHPERNLEANRSYMTLLWRDLGLVKSP